MRMDRVFVFLGALGALSGVALGAFGAHVLRGRLSAPMFEVYQTGVHYHLVHALGLVLVGCVAHWLPDSRLVRSAGWLLAAGIVLFSGSLYGLAMSGGMWLGFVTPFGGLCFLLGWGCLAAGALRG